MLHVNYKLAPKPSQHASGPSYLGDAGDHLGIHAPSCGKCHV